jgi:hypothetical protein
VDIGGVWVCSEIDESSILGPWTLEERFKGCSVQNVNESFGVADAVPGTWGEIAGPLRPIRVLHPLIGFPFRQNKGLNDKSQFLGATH